MKLVCGRTYHVTVVTHRPKTACENRHFTTLSLVYCGGSCVDDAGHHIGGGAWVHKFENENVAHQKRHQFFDLNILNITESVK